MADHPLRPATDRRLGGPLPHQLANQILAAQIAQGPKIPCFPPQDVCGISQSFDWLSPTTRYIPICYSPVRHSPAGASTPAAVRLACVKHAASVQSEPGSNSYVQSLTYLTSGLLQRNQQKFLSVCFCRSVRPLGTHTYRYSVSVKELLLTRRRSSEDANYTESKKYWQLLKPIILPIPL